TCSNPVNPGCPPGLPPDPAVVAPPLDRTVTTTMFAQTQFLFAGSFPIQTGVAQGTISPQRVAELSGRVTTDDGTPISGMKVTVVSHPELGQTLTRVDGQFDLVVNGGEALTLDFDKSGYLPAQRTLQVPWQEYVRVPDVIAIPPDANATA